MYKSSCSFKSEIGLGHFYLYRHYFIETCRELDIKRETDWFRMPFSLCSSGWVRVNIAYGVEVQFPIPCIAPPYAFAAHLDVRQDARLCLEIVVKRVHKECCAQKQRQTKQQSRSQSSTGTSQELAPCDALFTLLESPGAVIQMIML